MNFLTGNAFGRRGPRLIRLAVSQFVRWESNQEPCLPKPKEPCPPNPPPPKPKDPCSPPEPCQVTPPTATCPDPPPCPPMPPCPSTICNPIVDPNNPCNYTAPPCPDPDYPDITKLKKLQCFFQQDDGLPIYLKKGKSDAFIYQLTLVLTFSSLLVFLFNAAKLVLK